MKKIEDATRNGRPVALMLEDVPKERRKADAKKPLFLLRYE